MAEELAAKLDSTNVPGARTDANEVAEKICDVVDMPHGTRPWRFEVDPQQRQAMVVAEKANDALHELVRIGLQDPFRIRQSHLPDDIERHLAGFLRAGAGMDHRHFHELAPDLHGGIERGQPGTY